MAGALCASSLLVATDAHAATITGTDGADVLIGTHGRDTIHALAGNDIVQGGGRADVVHGEDGDDELDGNAGDDLLYTGAGRDSAHGGADGDSIFTEGPDVGYGEAGWDAISVDPGAADVTVAYGGRGGDILGVPYDAGTGVGRLFGGPGRDFLTDQRRTPGVAPSRLYGGPGRDQVETFRDAVLLGNQGDDEILLDGTRGVARGGAGDDHLYSTATGTGHNELHCGPGNDIAEVQPTDTVDPNCETVKPY